MRKFFAVAAVIIGSPILAQDTTEINSGNPLDRVVITTNKYPKKQSQTGKVVTVIDRRQLDAMGGRSVGEILNTVAGTTINGANNNLGTNQRISIRGSSDGNVLLLVDGIPVNDPSVISNYFDLNFFHPSQIERIEVLKGGQSTLYGSDAVAGVINIITKKSSGKKFSPYASAGYGSYQTLNANLGIRGQNNRIQYHLGTTYLSSAGFTSAFDSAGHKGFDRDGFEQSIIRGDLGIRLTSHLQWTLFGNYSRYQADIDAAAFTDDRDFIIENKNLQAGSGLMWKQKNGSLRLNYHFNYVDRFYFDDSIHRASFAYFSRSTYLGRTHYAELYENYRWNRVSLLAGVDYRYFNSDQVYRAVSPFGPFETRLGDTADMWLTSPYASLVYHHQGLNVELGGRWNHHSQYGDHFTYTFNPSYLIQERIKLFANISSAFKTPSLYQLFDPFTGNTGLDPEKSTVLEGGAEWYGDKVFFRANGFYRKTRNAIQFIITDPTFFSGQYRNINNQRNYGTELELTYRSDEWNFHTNYTFTRGRIRSAYSQSGEKLQADTSYNNLYRVPEHAFHVFAGWQLHSRLSLGASAKYLSSRLEPVYAAAPHKLEGYFLADLSARYQFNPAFRVFVDLKNITNKQYFDILGYQSRRFHFYLGFDIQL